jgi:hypothetical protein
VVTREFAFESADGGPKLPRVKDASFKAPWGLPLILMTGFCGVMCLLIPVFCFITFHAQGMVRVPLWGRCLIVAVPLLTVLVSSAFMVRGYSLGQGTLGRAPCVSGGFAGPRNLIFRESLRSQWIRKP